MAHIRDRLIGRQITIDEVIAQQKKLAELQSRMAVSSFVELTGIAKTPPFVRPDSVYIEEGKYRSEAHFSFLADHLI